MNIPTHKSVITFSEVPNGSYARTGEAYRVTVRGKGRRAMITLTNVKRGSSTDDTASCYRFAIWSTA